MSAEPESKKHIILTYGKNIKVAKRETKTYIKRQEKFSHFVKLLVHHVTSN